VPQDDNWALLSLFQRIGCPRDRPGFIARHGYLLMASSAPATFSEMLGCATPRSSAHSVCECPATVTI
jgi:hypothetical protein